MFELTTLIVFYFQSIHTIHASILLAAALFLIVELHRYLALPDLVRSCYLTCSTASSTAFRAIQQSVTHTMQQSFVIVLDPLIWAKLRTSYATKSWCYTTNHKRIALNYFSFIFVSGTAGMGLATVIRLEFAYPGVGVLAGDSLQYLSIATAHGVIMVFFMIMPSLFGAFGNFLLPTQLGVHDVAFPRLNSAAFWFLPGGLVMLVHLVCVDRRYQRMNCFNIRELQSMLKQKYFSDILSSNDHHKLLNEAVIGLRYKNNHASSINPDMLQFSNFGTFSTLRNKVKPFPCFEARTVTAFYELDMRYILTIFGQTTLSINPFSRTESDALSASVTDLGLGAAARHQGLRVLSVLMDPTPTLLYITRLIRAVADTPFHLTALPTLEVLSANFSQLGSLKGLVRTYDDARAALKGLLQEYQLVGLSAESSSTQHVVFSTAAVKTSANVAVLGNIETLNSVRFLRYHNPLIKYEYRAGNYLRDWGLIYPSLMTSIIEIFASARRAPWLLDEDFQTKLSTNYEHFLNYLTLNAPDFVALGKARIPEWSLNNVRPIYNYFGVINTLKSDTYTHLRWVSLNTLNQKFSSMFSSSSIQAKTVSNWRQLKFSREAWRCKLLASRNQNALYRRFTSEAGLIWTIERNASDLLPGWAMITPFSARTRYTAVGKTDIGLMGVLIVLNASVISSANFLVTYRYLSTLNNRKMRDARSFFAESLIVASWMMIAANPMLVIGIIMLLFDRHWQTSFFDYSGGGDTVLFQHMFWFFGHPEVYVIMIPVFGFTNTILSYYLRKRVSARSSLMYSMYTIAFLGFFVWGHHMYMVGLAHTTRMLFSTLTVMISVPAATKLMHWSVTLVNSYFTMEVPFLWALTFIYFFISGGVSGMCVAHTGMDVLFHDTFYVIGHFHVMLAGSGMMGIFSAFYFYFPAMYGVRYSRVYAYIHYIYYVIGQFLTVVPMLWLGYCGMPRRVLDYPSTLGGWHAIATAGHLLSVFAMLSFFLMIYDSTRQAKPIVRSNFGVGRFNTRLNFYLFEANRLCFIQGKSLYNHRFYKNTRNRNTGLSLLNLSRTESTLFTYRFSRTTR